MKLGFLCIFLKQAMRLEENPLPIIALLASQLSLLQTSSSPASISMLTLSRPWLSSRNLVML